MALTASGSGLQPLPGALPAAAASSGSGEYDLDNAAKVREDQCRLGYVLRKGGASMKAVARGGLAGTEAELHTAANSQYWTGTPLAAAFAKDKSWSDNKITELYGRNAVWNTSLDVQEVPAGYTDAGFKWVPDEPSIFVQTGLMGWMSGQFWKAEEDFYVDLTPPAGQESVGAVTKTATARYSENRVEDYDDWAAWEDMTFMHPMYADDARIFLQNGGFPTIAPDPGSMEFRIDVENLKARFASCSSTNPPDPHHVLRAELTTASMEWQAELAGQRTQRDTILDAESQAHADLAVASQAMGESLGQSLIASRLTEWQAYWLKQDPDKIGLSYPTKAEFETVKKRIAQVQARATGRLYVASRAALHAKGQADKIAPAQQDAYTVADIAGLPRGRGLMYAQQAAQVTKASAAAALAAAKATETASNATRASATDSKALNALAQTQAHATAAQFRRIAAQEAAAQAEAAAEGTAAQAVEATKNATKAKAAQAKAEAAENTAKSAAADAKAKRTTAEAERTNAANARARADAQRAKAADAQSRAQDQRSAAASARSAAETAGGTAATKRNSAELAESRATLARDAAMEAERKKDATGARARALEAAAAAAEGSSAAGETRRAATEARTAANQATTAATNARSAANQASQAAIAADAAATEAEGAAARSKAAADAAAADAAVTGAQVKKAHAAAAEAIGASEAAAQNVKNAEALAKEAAKQAVQARQDATASRTEANSAGADAIRTAGFAYATGQAALAARDSAAQVVKPANDAIELGSPYKETDASAGLAVLIGQAAKTAGEQQEAVAKAKADQAAKAAVEAAALAARSDADAKLAATAAAEAADWAAKAAKSVTQARASAAEAAAAAKAAKQAEANTVEYDRQANIDALAAGKAAGEAATEASAARSAATDAEQDASSARDAAADAESDASAARGVATESEKNATAAEAAAANAQSRATEADQAADRAEEEQRKTEKAAAADRIAADGSDAGADLTSDEDEILLANCGQECVDEFRDAKTLSGQSVMDWLKANGGEILLEFIGVNDLKRCFSEGDVESCLWTLVNVAALAIPVTKLPSVAAAIIRVGSGITKFLEESVTAKRTLDRIRKLIKDVKEGKGPCSTKPKVAAHSLAAPIVTAVYHQSESSSVAIRTVAEVPGVGTIVKQNGITIQIYSNDHGPAHAHVKGKGPEVRIGQNGKPLAGNPELTKLQQAVVTENIRTIRDNIRVAMERHRDNGGC